MEARIERDSSDGGYFGRVGGKAFRARRVARTNRQPFVLPLSQEWKRTNKKEDD
jgi:hypothetical protein